MFQPRPHGAIAVGPLQQNAHHRPDDVNSLRALCFPVPSFLSWRMSFAASASSQSRKRDDLGERCRRLRADDPIGLGETQFLGKWAHQAAADEIGGGQRRAGQRNALSIDRRIDHHAHAVEHRAMRKLGALDAGGLQPSGPVLPVIDDG